jgi:uncharacterized membrane protein
VPTSFAISTYDLALFVHIVAVVVAFGGIFAYPLLFAVAARSGPSERAALHRFQSRYGRSYVNLGLLLIILAGAYMATDRDLWSEPWVSGPLLIALIIGGVSGGYLIPRESRLAELATSDDRARYEKTLGDVKKVGALLSLLVLVAIFLMVTKPG